MKRTLTLAQTRTQTLAVLLTNPLAPTLRLTSTHGKCHTARKKGTPTVVAVVAAVSLQATAAVAMVLVACALARSKWAVFFATLEPERAEIGQAPEERLLPEHCGADYVDLPLRHPRRRVHLERAHLGKRGRRRIERCNL